MVQTKRQIIRDTDRFGGYGVQTSRDTDGSRELYTDFTPSDISSVKNNGSSGKVFVSDEPMLSAMPPITAAPKVAPKADNLYTTRETMASPEVLPKREKQSKPVRREDIMPSIKTRAYVSEAPAAVPQEPKVEAVKEHRARTNLDSKTKVMLIVYVAVALALAIAVIATGVSISRATARAQSVMDEIAQKQAVIVEQKEKIANITNDSTIRDEAIKNGMVESQGPAYSVDAAEKIDYPTPEPHTNGFDKFADAFGGFVS